NSQQPESRAELGYSPDPLAQRQKDLLATLGQIEPALIKDNQLDIDALKALLGQENLTGPEHYELSWAGKSDARREIQKSSSNILRPAANNPERAPHMLIEGENLEVLRVLQKSYYGKVKMIYIDPPYNTGNDSFVYPDDYAESLDEYLKRTGEKNEAGLLNKQSLWKKNSKESGHYHSNWLSMMYPRLYLARNLLREDGVIFISIDDNEAANLKLLCDEVFGGENFISILVWERAYSPKNDAKYVSSSHDYVVFYAKNISRFSIGRLDRSKEANDRYSNPDNDPRGVWKSSDMSVKTYTPENDYEITTPSGRLVEPPTGRCWSLSKKAFFERLNDNRIWFGSDGNSVPSIKRFLSELKYEGMAPQSLMFYKDVGHSQEGSKELTALLDAGVFDGPKPVRLLRRLTRLSNLGESSLVLDFFAGSGTTAQAVMELNLEDGGNRQCICVQMPEVLEEKSEAYKAGYRTIADITRARIDKVIEKLKAEHPDKTKDLACAHFTLASSNFQAWRSDVKTVEAVKAQMELSLKAEKPGVTLADAETEQAMLTELLLKLGLGALGVDAISKPITQGGVKVHRVLLPDDRDLWLCFEPYKPELKEAIVKQKPAQVILLSSAFQGEKADEALANLQLELAALDINLTVV
ncbi:MAG: site-specific DNA-methyltransferase, partial [Lautropia sp.]|nr:site-specific DNA-methyltransferase [Lautropia sp.]